MISDPGLDNCVLCYSLDNYLKIKINSSVNYII